MQTSTSSYTATCDKCEGENDRANESNYCTRCSAEYQARIALDPETRPVGTPALTADTITDEDIRRLRDEVFVDPDSDEIDRQEADLLEHRATSPDSEYARRYRAECARLIAERGHSEAARCTDNSWVWHDEARSIICLGCGRVSRRRPDGSVPQLKHRRHPNARQVKP